MSARWAVPEDPKCEENLPRLPLYARHPTRRKTRAHLQARPDPFSTCPAGRRRSVVDTGAQLSCTVHRGSCTCCVDALGRIFGGSTKRTVGGNAVSVAVGGDDAHLLPPRLRLPWAAWPLPHHVDPRFVRGQRGIDQGDRSLLDNVAAFIERLAHICAHSPDGCGDEASH